MPTEIDDNRLKKIIFRSQHRGCKETDLVLGAFAEKRLSALKEADLQLFERLLDENDADIWDWIVGKTEAPLQYQSLLGQLRELSVA